jgi:hypothetical protein
MLYANELIGFKKSNSGYLAAVSLATVPVTPMTFVKFNFKFANPSKSYEVHETRIRPFAFTLWRDTWYFKTDKATIRRAFS